MRQRTFVLSTVTLFVGGVTAYSLEAQDSYALFELCTNQTALDLSESGDVVGACSTFGFAWRDGRFIRLALVASPTAATGVSDGVGACGYTSRLAERIAIFWPSVGVMVNLGTLGGVEAEAAAMNQSGLIVGWSDIDPNTSDDHAFLWDGDEMIDLGVLPDGLYSRAYDINDDGVIVGRSVIFGGARAVVWRDRIISELDSGGRRAEALCINSQGDIGGFVYQDAVNRHATLWPSDGGDPINIHDPSLGDSSDLVDLNDAGWGVGHFDAAVGFLWDSDTSEMSVLSELLPPRPLQGFATPTAINNAGQIVGQGDDRPMLLSPVYPSFQLGSAVPGEAGRDNTMVASVLTPGVEVTLVVGDFGGGAVIPGCPVQQNALQIHDPFVVSAVTADANGEAHFLEFVPVEWLGQTKLIQAVVGAECRISNLVEQRFD